MCVRRSPSRQIGPHNSILRTPRLCCPRAKGCTLLCLWERGAAGTRRAPVTRRPARSAAPGPHFRHLPCPAPGHTPPPASPAASAAPLCSRGQVRTLREGTVHPTGGFCAALPDGRGGKRRVGELSRRRERACLAWPPSRVLGLTPALTLQGAQDPPAGGAPGLGAARAGGRDPLEPVHLCPEHGPSRPLGGALERCRPPPPRLAAPQPGHRHSLALKFKE